MISLIREGSWSFGFCSYIRINPSSRRAHRAFFTEYSRRGVGPASYGPEAADFVRDQMAQGKALAKKNSATKTRRHEETGLIQELKNKIKKLK